MGAITIPNTFIAGTNAEAAKVNANFTVITDEANGELDNENIADDAAIAESKLAFDATSGHDHSGSTNGKTIAGTSVSLAQVNHASNGRGTLKMKLSSAPVSIGPFATVDVTFTGEAFTNVPALSIYGIYSYLFGIITCGMTGFAVYNYSGNNTNFSWAAIGI